MLEIDYVFFVCMRCVWNFVINEDILKGVFFLKDYKFVVFISLRVGEDIGIFEFL